MSYTAVSGLSGSEQWRRHVQHLVKVLEEEESDRPDNEKSNQRDGKHIGRVVKAKSKKREIDEQSQEKGN